MLFDIESFDKHLFSCFYRAGRFVYGTSGRFDWKGIAFHTNIAMGVDLTNLKKDDLIHMTPALAKKYYLVKFKDTKYDFVEHLKTSGKI